MTKYLRKSVLLLKRERFILASEFSIHGQLASCLWACREAAHHGGSMVEQIV
jgi:hypothetical protein